MNISKSGLDFIKSHERCVLFTYDDAIHPTRRYREGEPVRGTLTIGWGHTSGSGLPVVKGPMVIFQKEADEILARDVGVAERSVNSLVKVSLKQNEFDALVSFQYNTGGLGKSTLLKKLNAGDYSAVPAELMKWNKAKGRVLRGLVSRRSGECALWIGEFSDKRIPARVSVDKPKPPKSMARSKIGAGGVATAAIGVTSGIQQFSDATNTAVTARNSMDLMFSLIQDRRFIVAVVLVVIGCAIWNWRRQLMKELAS